MAVGCSHGYLADPAALAKVLEFKRAYKPDRIFHLGDFTDQTAFRGGAKGTRDECVSIKDDLTSGLNFLEQLAPTDVLNGNHEIRLWELADHPNELISRAAGSVISDIRELLAKLGARYVEGYDINRDWIDVGDCRFLHGWMFSQNALMEHAEHFGNVVMAHLHIASMVPGRRSDHPHGYCTGTLANIPAMRYANRRRATARWSHGIVYGVYSDQECLPQLTHCPPNQAANWVLPI